MMSENSEEWKKREEERIQKQLQMRKPTAKKAASNEIPAWKKKQLDDEERVKKHGEDRKKHDDEIKRLKVQEAIKEQESEANKPAIELSSPKSEERQNTPHTPHETEDAQHVNPFHLTEEAQQEAESERAKREEERLSKALEKKEKQINILKINIKLS